MRAVLVFGTIIALCGASTSVLAQAEAIAENEAGRADAGGGERGGLMAFQEPGPYETLVPGIFARRILSAPSSESDYRVEVWALLVGPDTQADEVRLPGAATLLVRSGRVTMTSEAGKVELTLGDSALAPEGAPVGFLNPDPERPAHLRAVVVTATGG